MVEVAFKAEYGKFLPRIIGFSIVLHILVIFLVYGVAILAPEPKPEKIPVFDVIKLPPPKGVRHKRPTVPKTVAPKPAEPKPIEKPKPLPPVPKIEKQIKPQEKVQPTPQPVVETPKPQPVEPAAVEDNFDLPESDEPEGEPDGMDLPNMSGLRAVGDLEMDPLMQVYLEQLQMILMQNFSPPAGLTIPRGNRTSVQFTIQRSGKMTAILLKKSSGNSTWDRLAMRAVNISRLPPLPPNYRAPILPLVFDFKEK